MLVFVCVGVYVKDKHAKEIWELSAIKTLEKKINLWDRCKDFCKAFISRFVV